MYYIINSSEKENGASGVHFEHQHNIGNIGVCLCFGRKLIFKSMHHCICKKKQNNNYP